MPPVEAWRKVYINETFFTEDPDHSIYPCTACHGGVNSADFDVAHETVVRDPSGTENDTCNKCHAEVAMYQADSLHYSLRGYDTLVYARSAPEHYDTIEQMQGNHCNSCHTTCGQCHVSQPTSVGGGLLEGHVFQATPPMGRTCTACHGSRVGNEYTGKNEGFPADVHIRLERMSCTDCHTMDEMHGVGAFGEATNRYDGPQTPSCESCHEDAIAEDTGIAAHLAHPPDMLACQVCHATTYNNCWSCHTEQSEAGEPYYVVDWSALDFRIGLNPSQSEARPYEYVTLRHVPAHPEQFDHYGENLLPNFDVKPTWVYAMPHNIQRITPQSERCENCHTNDAIFLTEDTLVPAAALEAWQAGELPDSLDPAAYLEANRAVLVTGAPPLPEGYEPAIEEAAPAAEDEADEEELEEMFE